IRSVRPASRPYDLRFMRGIVGMLLLLAVALNAPSTARAADRCVRLGLHPGGAHGIVALRAGERLVATCPHAVSTAPLTEVTVVGAGLAGTLRSPETRVDGLVGLHGLEASSLRGGGHADLERLRGRLETSRGSTMKVRVLLGIILISLAVFAPRRGVMGGPAAISASLLLSALGWSSLTLLAVLTLALALLPWRALWVFFPAYLAVLVLSPETQSLALLGPHPWGGGRFYGVSNDLETLLLAPALVLGRAGADGGGIVVLLAAYARLVPRARRTTAAAAVVVLAVAFVLLDAATGGSSHVTDSVLHGHVFHDLWHRFGVSWHALTGAWGRGVVE